MNTEANKVRPDSVYSSVGTTTSTYSSSRVDHETYLQNTLKSKKMELEELHIKNRINIASYNVATDALEKQINSIERQLEGVAK